MRLESINDDQLTQLLLNDIKLAEYALCDEALSLLKKEGIYKCPLPNKIGVFINDKLIGCVVSALFTTITCEVHLYLNTDYHNQGIAGQVHSLFIDYLKANSKCITMISFTPAMCKYIQAVFDKYQWTKIGVLPKGIEWRGKIQDLLIYSRGI